jgi:hypothetical protein
VPATGGYPRGHPWPKARPGGTLKGMSRLKPEPDLIVAALALVLALVLVVLAF